MGDALVIDDLLEGLGFDTAGNRDAARAVLEEAGLTRAGKANIDAGKRARVEALLERMFLVTCGDRFCCGRAGMRRCLPAARSTACRICQGSANRRALVEAEEAMARAGIARVVIVGGGVGSRQELEAIKSRSWELRLVDGTGRRTLEQAVADARWADVVVLWGSTPLDHKVSGLYVQEVPGARCLQTARRGLSALLLEVAVHARRRS
ncbi:MAG: hypothetical protein RL199_1465 [Pseudomonadota bacterium]